MTDVKDGKPDLKGSPKTPDISKIVEKYSELKKYSGQELAWMISAIHSENSTVGNFLGDVRENKPTGNIEYAQKNLQEMLDGLPKHKELERFVNDESAIHKKHEQEARNLIGTKTRGEDGVYKPDPRKLADEAMKDKTTSTQPPPLPADGQLRGGHGR